MTLIQPIFNFPCYQAVIEPWIQHNGGLHLHQDLFLDGGALMEELKLAVDVLSYGLIGHPKNQKAVIGLYLCKILRHLQLHHNLRKLTL